MTLAWPRFGDAAGRLLRQPLALGLGLSVVVHLMLLSLHFVAPQPLRLAPVDARLEVVLLNARGDRKPLKAEVLAQANLEAGGDRDEGRARSPLRAERESVDADSLRVQRRRLEQLEEEQRRLIASARSERSTVNPAQRSVQPSTTPAGRDEQDVERAIARLQAQIDRNLSDYSKRPRRLTYGVNAVGVNYARYVDDWATRVERIGTQRYPPEARGQQYDSIIVTVEIDRHGNVVGVVINRKSRFEALNRAVRDIVHAGAPYARFSPEMIREGDILQIVRTWNFTNGTLSTDAVRTP